MTQPMTKTALLQQIHERYTQLEQLLTSLLPEQLTTPGVNGPWSVKDNLAHLTDWMGFTIQKMQAVSNHVLFINPFDDLEDDEANEVLYQAAKALSYPEVQAQFQNTFQQFIHNVEELSEEQLHAIPAGSKVVLIQSIIGNSTEHFQEHRLLIEHWLAQ